MPRYKIIANPVAGRGAGDRAVPQVERILNGYGLDFDVVRTERVWHAADLAQEAAVAGYDAVVALGGDGTSNEVLNGLMRARQTGMGACAMGVLCVGTGNDFAYGVDALLDLEDGCRALAQGYRRTIDVGRAIGGLCATLSLCSRPSSCTTRPRSPPSSTTVRRSLSLR
jgi:diacylglycerol kinase family enzyme